MGGVLIWGAAAWAAPCDPEGAVAGALQDLLAAELARVTERLRESADDPACGAAAPAELLARRWLLEGAANVFAGDLETGDAFLAAARAVSPDTWIPELGAELQKRWEAARPAGNVVLSLAGVPPQAQTLVDGAPSAPGPIATGPHLVQVLIDGLLVGSRSVTLDSDAPVVFEGLPAPAPPPDPLPTPDPVATSPAPVAAPSPPVPPPPAPAASARSSRGGFGGVWLGSGIGVVASSGELAGPGHAEPATKVVVPGELGAIVRFGPAWFRASGTAGLLPTAEWVYGRDGAWAGTPVALGGYGAVGGRIAGWSPGVGAGVSWPGRKVAFACLGRSLPGPLAIELRPGVAFPSSERPVELTVGLLIGLELGG